MSDYNRSCADEIDHAKADQMHTAALQISKTCFDLKKLCVSVLGACMALLVKFTENHVDHSLFAIGIILVIGFWLSDATAYFYQKSLRVAIDGQFKAIAERSGAEYALSASSPAVKRALFNMSMSLYFVLLSVLAGAWLGFARGWIG